MPAALQTTIVAALLAWAAGYSLCALLPAAWRRALAAWLLRLPALRRWAWLQQAAGAAGAAGCGSGCGACGAAAGPARSAAPPAWQPMSGIGRRSANPAGTSGMPDATNTNSQPL